MNTEISIESTRPLPGAPALSADSALDLGTRASAGRPLTRLLVLSERQLEHVNAWLNEGVAYRKIVDLCRTEFQKEIPHMTFVRYANRLDLFRHLDDLADSKEAVAEFSKYAATGDATFSTNTLALLEQQAFDLAIAHHRDGDAADLHTLEKLSALINKARNTRARERHAAVQEQKLALRREELQFKRDLAAARLNPPTGGTSSTSPTSSSRPDTSTHQAAQAHRGITQDSELRTQDFDHPTSPSRDAFTLSDDAKADLTSTKNPIPVNPVQNPHPTNPVKPSLIISPNPLPPEIVEENRRYAEKLRTGKIIFDTSGPFIRDIELPDDASGTPSVAPSSAQPETAKP